MPAISSRPGLLIAAAALTLAMIVTAVVALVVNNGDSTDPVADPATSIGPGPSHSSTGAPSSHSPGPSTGSTTTIATAVNWVRANLETGSTVLAGSAGVSALRASGFTAVSATHLADARTKPHWVLSTPNLREMAASDPALAARLQGSAAVARFGSGDTATTVMRYESAKPARVAALEHAAAVARQTAGLALLGNQRITVSAAAAKALRAGQLDLRAETFIALLAGRMNVRLSTIVRDPAEAAASQPARTITLTAPTASEITDVRSMLAPAYSPSDVTTRAGTTTLVWSVPAMPVRSQ